MINDPNVVYTLVDAKHPDHPDPFSNFVGRTGNRVWIYLGGRALDVFPETPPADEPDKPTKGEVVVHELAEAMCRAQGGSTQACHDGAATNAQKNHRQAMGQLPNVGPNVRTERPPAVKFRLPLRDWLYELPWGPLEPSP
jgi:hypothetical protein